MGVAMVVPEEGSLIQYPISVGGVSTRVLEDGSGPDTVVFIHGVGARADRWSRAVTRSAAEGFRAIALDLPGHGFATKDEHFSYTVPGFARFLDGLLQELSAHRVHLVGTSMGGHIAARFACDNADRAASLVLVGALGIAPLGAQGRTLVAQSIRSTAREAIAQKLRTLVFDPRLVNEAWIREETLINNSPGAQAAFELLAGYFGTRVDDDLVRDDLAKITAAVPMLLVWGAEDRFVPLEVGTASQQSLPGAGLKVIERAAHAPYLEKPGVFNRILLAFLRQVRGQATAAQPG